ncbi:MAG: hypothetical protein L0241_22265 [Planctomycetia bacterium]|nr:hypothetical protein [Planctomycetia bacterium]
MAQPPKVQPPANTPTPAPPDPPPYPRVYAWLFQAWLVMFLFVICGALIFYLLSYIPRG